MQRFFQRIAAFFMSIAAFFAGLFGLKKSPPIRPRSLQKRSVNG